MKEDHRMNLTEQLTYRIQDVADVAGKPGREGDFTSRYSALLSELTAAMTLMKELAIIQGGWLQGEAGKSARLN